MHSTNAERSVEIGGGWRTSTTNLRPSSRKMLCSVTEDQASEPAVMALVIFHSLLPQKTQRKSTWHPYFCWSLNLPRFSACRVTGHANYWKFHHISTRLQFYLFIFFAILHCNSIFDLDGLNFSINCHNSQFLRIFSFRFYVFRSRDIIKIGTGSVNVAKKVKKNYFEHHIQNKIAHTWCHVSNYDWHNWKKR